MMHTVAAQQKPEISANKKSVLASVEKQQAELIAMSDKIWSYAETALSETKSVKVLYDYALAQGFTIQNGVAEMPTAFIASLRFGKTDHRNPG